MLKSLNNSPFQSALSIILKADFFVYCFRNINYKLLSGIKKYILLLKHLAAFYYKGVKS